MSPIRQLAAIMFIDIEGYTALMQEDEAMALKLVDKLKAKLQEVVAAHDGRILEHSGDGALCSFTSTLACVALPLLCRWKCKYHLWFPYELAFTPVM